MVKVSYSDSQRDMIQQPCFQLSRQASCLWAKAGVQEENNLWESLYVHMLDSAGIAGMIWSRWLSDSTRSYICAQTGLDLQQAESLVAFVVGIHDIGKATPNFQRKVPECAETVQEEGLCIPADVPASYPHAFMGELIVQEWLIDDLGWDEDIASGLSQVIGGHHGVYPTTGRLGSIQSQQSGRSSCVLGDNPWHDAQHELLAFISGITGFQGIADKLHDNPIPTSVGVLLTGVAIMSDWIASNTDLFPLVPAISSRLEEKGRVDMAWRSLALPVAEHFVDTGLRGNALFRHRFPTLPQGATLRPVQAAAMKSAQEASEACLLIIEADTGGGKTEASLLAAEVLADKFGEGGLAYLLPTQATSNAMYARVEKWLETVHADDAPASNQDIHLLHGKAELNEDWRARSTWGESWMGDGNGSGRRRPGDALIAHQWFSGRKRGLLAPFVVGTVDQLLLMALKAKHVQLRHLGLAGKVAIIDEVHAYDAYMNVYLDRALDFLGAYSVPVILLSATLPPNRREQLMRAYQGKDSSRVGRRRPSRRAAAQSVRAPRTSAGTPAYPLITRCSADSHATPVYETCRTDARSTTFNIETMPDDDAALVRYLRECLVDGGCVCVLRNTVARAQHAYELVRDELGDATGVEIELVHSRFIAFDRSRNDARLLDQLGPRSEKRPHALVVVGTQVIEQSLDIDFDLLITDVAPVDLLLQRMGRVHRHKRSQRPDAFGEPRCVLTGIGDWDGGMPHFERGTSAIYQEAILLRTLLALGIDAPAKGCSVSTPRDTASLVEAVYGIDRDALAIPDDWKQIYQGALEKARKARSKKESAAHSWLLGKLPRASLVDWMEGKTGLTDEVRGSARVRDSQESIEVVPVVRRGNSYEMLSWVAKELGVGPSLGDGFTVPDDDAARAAALCTVSLPPRLSAPYISDRVIDALEDQGRSDGWQDSRWLRGELPLVLDGDLTADIELPADEDGDGAESFAIRYSREEGLTCESTKEGQ